VLLAFSSMAGAARGLSVSSPWLVPCREITAGTAPAPGQVGVQTALGVIAVAAPAYDPHPAVPVQSAGRWTYWMKGGVGVRLGTYTITVTVAKAWRSRAAISWGTGPIVSSLRFSGCSTAPQVRRWNAYVGGFYLRAPSACVPLVFSVGQRSTTVRFGIGRRCP
jgi:hypothetical protein